MNREKIKTILVLDNVSNWLSDFATHKFSDFVYEYKTIKKNCDGQYHTEEYTSTNFELHKCNNND